MGKRLSVYHFIAHFPTTSPLFTQRLVSPAWCAPFLFGSLCSSFAKALHGGFYLAFNANQCLAVLGLYTHGVVQAQKRKQIYISKLYPALKHYYTDCLFRNFTKRPFFQPNSSNFNKKWPYRSRQRVSLSGACSFRLKLRFPAEHTHVCAVCFCVTHLSCHLVLEQKSL